MVLLTRGDGKRLCGRVLALRYGQMVVDTLVTGGITRPKAGVYSTIQMVIYTRGSGSMIRLMGRGLILTPMGLSTWDSGKTISRMAMGWSSG
jgi:hypothetical protein